MIPKKIHYCWFGGKEKPDLVKKCIESWQKYCPGYEIIEWNEDNFDLESNIFVKQAYEHKKYAFISDYVRLYVLYNYGGLYFDTDLEVVQNLDKYLKLPAFTGYESDEYCVTAIMGSEKHNKWIKKLLDYYQDKTFIKSDNTLDTTPNTIIITNITVNDYHVTLGNKKIVTKDMTIYPKEYFSPKDCLTGIIKVTKNTHTIHHFNGSWLPKEDQKSIMKRRKYVSKYGEEKGLIIYNKIDKTTAFFKRWALLPIRIFKNPSKYIDKLFKKNKSNKKKILFTNFNMEVGGISKALINMLEEIDYDKYDVTLYLQFKEGEMLPLINKNVHVMGYNLSKIKFSPLRKIINGIKYFRILTFNKNKYDFAGCYSPPGNIYSSKLVRIASKNNAIWVHTNLVNCVANDPKIKEMFPNCTDSISLTKAFVDHFKYHQFKKIIFVSEDAKKSYINIFKEDKNKCIICRNFINYQEIILKSKEKIDLTKAKNTVYFLNVSRHTEFDKALTRIINASIKLKNEGYNFKIIMVGSGEDNKLYKKLVKQESMNDYFIFTGLKHNPYPYYAFADCFVLSSRFEGFPTTFSEAMTLNIPIITTDVSDASVVIKDKYGIVVKNNDTDIYNGMKLFLDEGYKIENKFEPEKNNQESLRIIKELVDGKH